ncbi:MAG: hypothetical protein ACTSSP_00445 [Candidatus Asgardarchaeia archaeon]
MISRTISIDIVRHLQKKGYSVDDISNSMGTSPQHINNVIDKKEPLTPDDINIYLNNTKISFWEFAYEAIPLSHLPEKAQKRILLCKEIAEHLKKKNKK